MKQLTLELPEILRPHQALLETIAESWFAYGATNVAVWGDGQVFANWSVGKADVAENQPTHTQISAPIKINKQAIAQLHVFGPNNRLKKKRLRLDAQVIVQQIENQMLGDEQKTLNRRIAVLQDQLDGREKEIASLEAELDQASQHFDTFLRLSQIYLDQLDLSQYLQIIREIAADLLPVEMIFTFVDSLDVPQELHAHPRPLTSPVKIKNYIMDQAADELIINHSPNIRDLPTSVRNIIALPIVADEHLRLRLGFVNKSRGDFTNGDVQIARLFTDQIGRHVEQIQNTKTEQVNVGLQSEMVTAFEVQHDLFPQELPELPGIDLYAYSRSAKHVGGDFYDYSMRYDGQLAFSVGDVSGKGMSSALMMGIIRTLLKSKANRGDLPTPQEILAETVGDIHEDLMRVKMFATTFVAFVNPVTMDMLYANAGQAPVIFCPLNGETILLEPSCPPIGVLENTYALDEVLALDAGDCLIVATDGLSEAQNMAGEQFGLDRLFNIVRQYGVEATAAEIARYIFDEIDTFTHGAGQSDDQTLLILKVE